MNLKDPWIFATSGAVFLSSPILFALEPAALILHPHPTARSSIEDEAETSMVEDQREAERYKINPSARDYYERLGVERGATREEIQRAFRKAARLYHPDLFRQLSARKQATKEEDFKAINEAWEVLGDESNRRRYDELGFEAFSGRSQPRSSAVNIESVLDLILGLGNPIGAAQFILQIAPLLKTNPILKQRLVSLALDNRISRSHLFGFVVRQAAISSLAAYLESANELVEIFGRIVRDSDSDASTIRVHALLALSVRAAERSVSDFLLQIYLAGKQNFYLWKSEYALIYFPDPGHKDITAAALEALGRAASRPEVLEVIFSAAENSFRDHPPSIQISAARALKEVLRLDPSQYPRVVRVIQAQRYQAKATPALPDLFRSLSPVASRPEVRALIDEWWNYLLYVPQPLRSFLALLEVDPDLLSRYPDSLWKVRHELNFLSQLDVSELISLRQSLETKAHQRSAWTLLSLLYNYTDLSKFLRFRHQLEETLDRLAADVSHREIFRGYAKSDYNRWNTRFLDKIGCPETLQDLAR